MPVKKTKKLTTREIKKKSNEIQRKIILPKIFFLSVFISLLIVAAVFVFYNRLPPEVPLYYGLPVGNLQLADRSYLILPSSIALAFIILNLILSVFIKDTFLKKSLIITGLALSIFSAVTTIKIMLLVGNF